MNTVYEQEIAHLKEISAEMESFLKDLTGAAPDSKPRAPTGNFLTAMAAADDIDAYFNRRAEPKTIERFQTICKNIAALPKEYETLITDALSISVYGAFKRWSQGRSYPHPDMFVPIIKALHYGTSLIIHETPETREFRRFHIMARELYRVTGKAVSGTRWTNVEKPREDAPEYNDEAIAKAKSVQAQFALVDDNYVALMNEKLRQYKPTLWAEGMAPTEIHNDPIAMEKARAFNRAANKEALEEAVPYQTGERSIRDIVSMMDTDNFKQMQKLAIMASVAAGLYYQRQSLLTFDVNSKTGEVENVALPKPEPRVLQ